MTLNEIAYNIKNIVEGGIHGTDSNISIRQIKAMVHYHRAQLLLQYTDMGRYLSKSLQQTISSPAVGFFEMPSFVGFPNNRGIIEVMLRDSALIPSEQQINIPLVNESERSYHEASRFGMVDKYYATLSYNAAAVPTGALSGTENMIHIYNDGELFIDDDWTVYVTFIASNPSSVRGFSDATSNYPLPDELIPTLTEIILKKEFNMMLAVGNDPTNNSIDDKIPGPYHSVLASKVAAQPKAKAKSRAKRTR